MVTSKETQKHLANLVTAHEDAAEGYRTASEGVESPELKAWMTEQASTRTNFATELRPYWSESDQDRDGSTSGKIHRGWVNLKAGMNVSDEELCKECAFGEDKAIEQFEEALSDENLDSPVQEIAQKQLSHIRSTKSELEARTR